MVWGALANHNFTQICSKKWKYQQVQDHCFSLFSLVREMEDSFHGERWSQEQISLSSQTTTYPWLLIKNAIAIRHGSLKNWQYKKSSGTAMKAIWRRFKKIKLLFFLTVIYFFFNRLIDFHQSTAVGVKEEKTELNVFQRQWRLRSRKGGCTKLKQLINNHTM